MSVRRLNALVWFGVIGGAAAWAIQFLFGMQLGLARCESPNARFQFPVHGWAIGLAAGALAILVLAQVSSVVVFRATREKETISMQRIHFLATVGLTVNPPLMAIAIMTGVGSPLLSLCQQA
jgi:hypothetical protein